MIFSRQCHHPRGAFLTGLIILCMLLLPSFVMAGTPVEGKISMVAAAHPLASQIGVEILKKGGNAVDAAVATAFGLGVVEPNASGLGGGGFIIIYLAKTKEIVAIDYREMAPLKATPDMYNLTPEGKVMNNESTIGHRAVAVPGTLAGLTMALGKYGTMNLKDVMSPAIRIAEDGYMVSPTLNEMMKDNFEKLTRFPAAAEIYLKNGLPYEAGDRLVLKDLAKTYRLIADKGPDVFYKGEIAEAIEREMKASIRGIITKEDLAAYRPVLRKPVRGSYRGYELISMSPPSSGGTHIIQILNILEGYDMAKLGQNSSAAIHIMAEAMKRVFADRSKYMGDTDFVKVPIQGLLSKAYADELRKEIKIDSVGVKIPAGDAPRYESGGTTHLSVMDKDGNMVALTQTINFFFGSGVLVPGTGIMLNDEMDDFIPKPGQSNSIEPRKRPLSSMSPMLVLKGGKPVLSIGSPGATRIISALPQILMNIVDYGMNLQEAIAAPRIHCMTGDIFMEARIPKEVQLSLVNMGHKLSLKKDVDLYFGGAQAVMLDLLTGKLYGAGDPRRDGVAIGY
ncbi:MAG: gamma-glutamyltransferase [Desulfobacteraceae bacterium]|nr:MAG: gamma-glutamyltransferase [Desulfobacteraceae bacterium]